MLGTFEATSRGDIYYDDSEIDSIYDRFDDLKIDIENKLEELKTFLASLEEKYEHLKTQETDLESDYAIAEQATHEDPDNEEAENTYTNIGNKLDDLYYEESELYHKMNLIEDHIYSLEKFLDAVSSY